MFKFERSLVHVRENEGYNNIDFITYNYEIRKMFWCVC